MFLNPKEAVEAYVSGCKAKSDASTGSIIIKSILAGMMIAMGAAGSSVAAHGIADVGVARLVAAVVFPVGLMMVILMGAELFTGDCLVVMGVPEKNVSPIKLIRLLVLVYIGNFIGSIFLAFAVFASGQLDYSGGKLGAYTIKLALTKATITPGKAITSGILCNILVCAAVFMAVCAKDIAGKLLVSFFVIMLFVTSGYEHCVANMYYITAGLFAKLNPAYVTCLTENYGIDGKQLQALNISNMLIKNQLPVTIGNIIGGIVFVGLPLYFLNRQKNNL